MIRPEKNVPVPTHKDEAIDIESTHNLNSTFCCQTLMIMILNVLCVNLQGIQKVFDGFLDNALASSIIKPFWWFKLEYYMFKQSFSYCRYIIVFLDIFSVGLMSTCRLSVHSTCFSFGFIKWCMDFLIQASDMKNIWCKVSTILQIPWWEARIDDWYSCSFAGIIISGMSKLSLLSNIREFEQYAIYSDSGC